MRKGQLQDRIDALEIRLNSLRHRNDALESETLTHRSAAQQAQRHVAAANSRANVAERKLADIERTLGRPSVTITPMADAFIEATRETVAHREVTVRQSLMGGRAWIDHLIPDEVCKVTDPDTHEVIGHLQRPTGGKWGILHPENPGHAEALRRFKAAEEEEFRRVCAEAVDRAQERLRLTFSAQRRPSVFGRSTGPHLHFGDNI